MVMAIDSPLSRLPLTRPQTHQATHGLQPEPQVAASFSPASARSRVLLLEAQTHEIWQRC